MKHNETTDQLNVLRVGASTNAWIVGVNTSEVFKATFWVNANSPADMPTYGRLAFASAITHVTTR